MTRDRAAPKVRDTTGLTGTMVSAWTIVTLCALALGSVWAWRLSDPGILIAFLAGPFITGLAVLGSMLLVRLGGTVREERMEVAPRAHRRESLYLSSWERQRRAPRRGG